VPLWPRLTGYANQCEKLGPLLILCFERRREEVKQMYRGSNGWLRLALAVMALATIAAFVGDLGSGKLQW